MIRDLSRKLRVRSILSYDQKVDPVSGDQETWVDTHEVHVTAGEIMLQDNGGAPYRAAMVDVIVDITALGVNGLALNDTRSGDTWYHIWIISDSGGLVKGLLSTSASNPELPADYIYKAYVGAIYNNGYNKEHNYLVSYYQNDQLAWAEKTYPLTMTAFPSIPTIVDLAHSVPSTAISVILEVSGLTAIGGNYISNVFVGPTSSGPWHNRWMMVVGTQQDAGGIDHVQFLTQCEIIIDSAQEIYAYVGTPNDRLEIHVLGWRY